MRALRIFVIAIIVVAALVTVGSLGMVGMSPGIVTGP